MEPIGKPAGWYPDPKDAGRRRYWDGTRWAALTQPPTIAERETADAPVGSPGNPIGAESVALAAAFASLTAARFDEPQPVASAASPGRRRHLLRRSRH